MLKFVMFPTETLQMLRGKSKALHVLHVMAAIRNVRTNETRFISKPVLADLCGISTRHTYRIIAKLEAMGLIELAAERRGEYMWHLPFCDQKTVEKAGIDTSNVKQFRTDEEIQADTERMLKEMNSNG